MRHGSLQMNFSYMYAKFWAWEMINGDIFVQEIKVSNAIFKFPTPLFH